MGEHLVKVLSLMRVMCGTRVTFFSFGTREYIMTFLGHQVYPPLFSNAKYTYVCYCASILGEMVWRKFLDRKKGISSAQSCMVFSYGSGGSSPIPLLPLLFLMYYCPIAAAVADVCSRSSSTGGTAPFKDSYWIPTS